MKQLLLIILLLTGISAKSQVLVQYDYMETTSTDYATAGWLTAAASAGWFANASVSPDYSASIYGLGAGASAYELDWYILPNITLNPANQHQLKFNLASYVFSNPTASTRGVDVGDYVEVRISTDGGFTYTAELRITGNSNARWDYSATGVVNHTANGSFTNSAAPAGDVYTSPAGTTTTAPALVMLTLPSGITQVAIDIFCRANAAGEEWWFDNIELWDITAIPLPVELISFNAFNTELVNQLIWKTATEHNSSYYIIERSSTGEFTENNVIAQKPAVGHSTVTTNYSYVDFDYRNTINYYQITQVDVDGQYKTYGPVAVDNRKVIKIVKIINALGQEVDETAIGILYEVYDDGTIKQIHR